MVAGPVSMVTLVERGSWVDTVTTTSDPVMTVVDVAVDSAAVVVPQVADAVTV